MVLEARHHLVVLQHSVVPLSLDQDLHLEAGQVLEVELLLGRHQPLVTQEQEGALLDPAAQLVPEALQGKLLLFFFFQQQSHQVALQFSHFFENYKIVVHVITLKFDSYLPKSNVIERNMYKQNKTVCHFIYILSQHYSKIKPHYLAFRVCTAILQMSQSLRLLVLKYLP